VLEFNFNLNQGCSDLGRPVTSLGHQGRTKSFLRVAQNF